MNLESWLKKFQTQVLIREVYKSIQMNSWIIWKKWHGFIKGFLKMKMSWKVGF